MHISTITPRSYIVHLFLNLGHCFLNAVLKIIFLCVLGLSTKHFKLGITGWSLVSLTLPQRV